MERRESRPSAREKHDEDGGRALKTPGRAVPRGIREDPPPTGTLSGSLSHKEQGLRGGVFCSHETVFHLVKLVEEAPREPVLVSTTPETSAAVEPLAGNGTMPHSGFNLFAAPFATLATGIALKKAGPCVCVRG